jgi:hypothetical protein
MEQEHLFNTNINREKTKKEMRRWPILAYMRQHLCHQHLFPRVEIGNIDIEVNVQWE